MVQLLARFDALSTKEGVPDKVSQFDASKFVRMATSHMEKHNMLQTSEVPPSLRQPIIQVVRADEAQFRNTTFFLKLSKNVFSAGNPPKVVGVVRSGPEGASDVRARVDMKARVPGLGTESRSSWLAHISAAGAVRQRDAFPVTW